MCFFLFLLFPSSSQDRVIGVVVSDPNGLCMSSTGILLPSSSGHIQSLFDVASRLSEEGEHPIIQVQGSTTEILISHMDGYTTGVARDIPFNIQQQQTTSATQQEQAELDPTNQQPPQQQQ